MFSSYPKKITIFSFILQHELERSNLLRLIDDGGCSITAKQAKWINYLINIVACTMTRENTRLGPGVCLNNL